MPESSALPGVRVGPMDPDATERFSQVSPKVNARTLLRLHRALTPVELQIALKKKIDGPRSQALDFDELADAIELPDGGEKIVGANVRGERDEQKVLTYTYVTDKSGRTAKWFCDFDPGLFPNSYEAGEHAHSVEEARKKGVPAQLQSAREQQLVTENAAMRRELDSLRSQIEGGSASPDADDGDGDGASEPVGEEPVPGYADLNVGDVRKLISNASDDEREDLKARILEYERANQNRATVITAAQPTASAD